MRLRDRLPMYDENFIRAADFIIYRSGVNTKAFNCSTGEVDFNNLHADVAINGAISKLTYAGTIFLQHGLYTLYAPIDFGAKAITLEGTHGGSTYPTTAAYGVSLKYNTTIGADYVIKVGQNGITSTGSQIRNLLIDCISNIDCLGGIHYTNNIHGKMENIIIDHVYNTATPGYGINIEGTGGGVAYWNILQNIHTRHNTVGIRLGEDSNACCIIGGRLTGRTTVATTGLLLDGTDTLCLHGPCDCELHAHANGIGVHIISRHSNSFFGLRCEGNMKDVVIDNGAFTGLNHFFGGVLTSAVVGYVPVTDNGSAKSYFYGISYYKTENWGTSTGTGAQQTIAHGLQEIPSCVMLSDKESAAGPYQSAAADITNIYVTAANNQDWSWFVRV